MKKINFLSFLLVAMFGFVFTSCDELTEDKTTLAGNLKVKNASAHYVGKAIIVDFQMENKSGKDLNDLILECSEISSDNGHLSCTKYYSMGEGSQFSMNSIRNVTIDKDETCNVRVKLTGDALQSGVDKINMVLKGYSKQLGQLEENTLPISCRVADNRVTANSVWTNDDKMAYGNIVVKRTDNDLYASVDITNNTGVDLGKVKLYINSVDNGNGTTSFGGNRYLIVDGNRYLYETSLTIGKGETRTVTLYIPAFFNKSARCLNATIEMASNYYEFAFGAFYLTSINVN